MPVRCLVIALFVVLGRSTVGLGGQLMELSNFPVQVLHNFSVHPERALTPPAWILYVAAPTVRYIQVLLSGSRRETTSPSLTSSAFELSLSGSAPIVAT